MKKKLKDFFNSLEASPEVIAHGCKKEVCQLRSYVSNIESDYIYPSSRVYNRITKITVHLQRVVSDQQLLRNLEESKVCIKKNIVVKTMKNIGILFILKLIILCVGAKRIISFFLINQVSYSFVEI